MSDDLTTIRNIGPAMAAALTEAGIADAATLRAIGPDAAYARLLAAGARPHFIAFYAMAMGLQGRPWNDCRAAEKAALRARFDALRAAAPARATTPTEIEAALDTLGLPQRRGGDTA